MKETIELGKTVVDYLLDEESDLEHAKTKYDYNISYEEAPMTVRDGGYTYKKFGTGSTDYKGRTTIFYKSDEKNVDFAVIGVDFRKKRNIFGKTVMEIESISPSTNDFKFNKLKQEMVSPKYGSYPVRDSIHSHITGRARAHKNRNR